MMLNKFKSEKQYAIEGEALFKRECKISQYNPIKYFATPSIFMTEKGELGAVLKLGGTPYALVDNEQLNHLQNSLGFTLKNLSHDIAIYFTHHRRQETILLKSHDKAGFAKDFIEEYHQQFQNKKMFVSDFYLTIIYNPKISDHRKLSEKLFKTHFLKKKRKYVKDFTSKINNLIQSLGAYDPRILGEIQTEEGGVFSEVLSFLSILVNGRKRNYLFPLQDIASFVPDGKVFIGDDSIHFRSEFKEEERFGAVLSIKEYATPVPLEMLNGLLSLPFEYIETSSFYGLPRSKTLAFIKSSYRRFTASEDDAISQVEELDEANDQVASNELSFGLHHHTLMVLSHTWQHLERNLTHAMHVYEDVGIAVVRERMNLENAYYAQIPSNMKRIKRRVLISSDNFSCLYPFHRDDSGYRDCNHLGDALMLAVTKNHGLYHFNTYAKASGRADDKSHGHTLIFAPTNSGKTAILTTIDAAFQKYKIRSFFFDRDCGCENYVRANRGVYYPLKMGVSTGFNPCQLSDTPSNREFLRNFFKELSTYGNENLTARDEIALSDLVERNYSLPFETRNLSNIAPFLPKDFSGRDSFSRYLNTVNYSGNAGSLAYLFDNPKDTLDLNVHCAGFDLTAWLSDDGNMKPELIPLSMYLFHRVEETIGKEVTGIYLDEGWQFLKKEYWVNKIRTYLNTGRKNDVFIMLATQQPENLADSPIGAAFIQSAASMLCLANANATEEVYCGKLHLTQKEFDVIKSLNPLERYFLFKQTKASCILRFPMMGLEKYLSVLSSNSTNRKMAENLRNQYGSLPEQWLPPFLNGENS